MVPRIQSKWLYFSRLTRLCPACQKCVYSWLRNQKESKVNIRVQLNFKILCPICKLEPEYATFQHWGSSKAFWTPYTLIKRHRFRAPRAISFWKVANFVKNSENPKKWQIRVKQFQKFLKHYTGSPKGIRARGKTSRKSYGILLDPFRKLPFCVQRPQKISKNVKKQIGRWIIWTLEKV